MNEDWNIEVDKMDWDIVIDKIEKNLGPTAQKDLLDKIILMTQKKVVELTPNKTGATRRSWMVENPNPNQRVLINSSPVMTYLEKGTKDHGPKTAEYLYFEWNGQLIRKKIVKGIKALGIIEKYLPEFEKMALEEMVKALKVAGVE